MSTEEWGYVLALYGPVLAFFVSVGIGALSAARLLINAIKGRFTRL